MLFLQVHGVYDLFYELYIVICILKHIFKVNQAVKHFKLTKLKLQLMVSQSAHIALLHSSSVRRAATWGLGLLDKAVRALFVDTSRL